ncbi:unnamed protein product [Notodromas monacha]|uniref:Uncharacterized protein n=1 Tax=Notodromas monacha TaxID=399045 RepID=A0A7R9GBZ6_9CRUS|nr:unnamed protein product [Notodromas monacha]CAG0917058.1 unnamed protein product [Notodromas monacha]
MASDTADALRIEVTDLKRQVEDLRSALDEQAREVQQSAHYGLVLLQEKQSLQERCDELETLFDNAKHDLDITREALAKFQTSHQASTKTGIEHEETLLSETAARESSLNTKIVDLEMDLKQTKQELDRILAERDRVLIENNELAREKEYHETEKRNIKSDLRELKTREASLLGDIDSLEEENINLQKLVSTLRTSQMEFEGAKHELRRLQEEVDIVNQQLEELSSLKRIAEKQMEEALEALQSEREAKYALKKELDQKMATSTSVYSFSNLAMNLKLDDSPGESDDDDELSPEDNPALKRLEADFLKQEEEEKNREMDAMSQNGTPPEKHKHHHHHNAVGNLFSEIHLNELRKLEQKLELADTEKMMLTQNLKEVQERLEGSKNEVSFQQARLFQASARLKALKSIQLDHQISASQAQLLKRELSELYAFLEGEMDEMGNKSSGLLPPGSALTGVEADTNAPAQPAAGGGMAKLRAEVGDLRSKLLYWEESAADLRSDLDLLAATTGGWQIALGKTQTDMNNLSAELSQLYHHVCGTIGETPSRILLSHVNQTSKRKAVSNVQDGGADEANDSGLDRSSESPPSLSHVETLRSKLKTSGLVFGSVEEEGIMTDPATVQQQVETLLDQIQYLKKVVEQAIGKAAKLPSEDSSGPESLTTVSLADLQEKTAIKKSISRVMLSCLRAMFAARCEEYVSQLEEAQRGLHAAEEEKKTLNSLLRMAIQQKLALSQRLEDMEMSYRDRGGAPSRRHVTARGKTVGGSQTAGSGRPAGFYDRFARGRESHN